VTDPTPASEPSTEVVHPDGITSADGAEVVSTGDGAVATTDETPEIPRESVTEPAKVMRIGSMVKQLLEEVRAAPLDEASRERLAEIYERSVTELSMALSPDLQEELHMLALPFDHEGIPSESELRVAKAQLVGWLEGLFHGIQATLMAQQFAARQQLEQMRELPGGPPQGFPQSPNPAVAERPGTYL
jgi:hypothetical protein